MCFTPAELHSLDIKKGRVKLRVCMCENPTLATLLSKEFKTRCKVYFLVFCLSVLLSECEAEGCCPLFLIRGIPCEQAASSWHRNSFARLQPALVLPGPLGHPKELQQKGLQDASPLVPTDHGKELPRPH